MADLLLDLNGDLDLTGDTLTLTSEGAESTAQRLSIRLKTFKGEYFLDLDFGTPYYQEIFIDGVSKSVVDSVIRQQILETPDVLKITDFQSTLDPSTREYSCTYVVEDALGEEIEGSL